MNIGQEILNIALPAIDGSEFNNESLRGKRYLITFFRFATCPFCNTRIAQLVSNKEHLGDDFEVVAIFESNLAHLQKHASKHFAKFPILADPDGHYYKSFAVRKSFLGMLKGMIFRIPTLMKAMFKGYIPREISSKFLIMPLSLLVDEKGIIQLVYQGKDEGDHLPLVAVTEFATNNQYESARKRN